MPPTNTTNGRFIRISEFCFQLEETGNDGEKQTQSVWFENARKVK